MIIVLLLPLLLLWVTGVRSLIALCIVIGVSISGVYISHSTYESRIDAITQLSRATGGFAAKVSLTGTVDQQLYR
jgi:hypothetical protein